MAKLCSQAMGRDPEKTELVMYDKKNFDFGEKKAFPMREQHFFCSVDKVSKILFDYLFKWCSCVFCQTFYSYIYISCHVYKIQTTPFEYLFNTFIY